MNDQPKNSEPIYQPKNPEPIDEYSEVGSNFRHGLLLIDNLIKSFVALNSVLCVSVGLFFNKLDSKYTYVVIAISIVGLVACFGAFIAYKRQTAYLRSWISRGKEIEVGTTLKIYSNILI